MRTLHHQIDCPKRQHYAALVFDQKIVYTEGDQRSRDCPGHGYPEERSTLNVISYIVFNDKADLEKWVIDRQSSAHTRSNYQIITAMPHDLTIKSTIELK